MKKLGKVEVAVMRQAWRDTCASRPIDRPSVAVALWGWEDLGSRYTIKRFDPEAIGVPEHKSGQDRIYQAVRRLKEAGLIEGDAPDERLTEEGRKVARAIVKTKPQSR